MEEMVESSPLRVATTTRLYEAIARKDVDSINSLFAKDPLILDQCIIEHSARFIQSSALHVAVHMGDLEVVRALLKLNPSMCLAHDQDGRNPLHVAAIKGHIDVLKELHQANSCAAQERTNAGETILHLCIKHKQLRALEILLDLTNGDGDQLLNSKDNDKNTALHLAVTHKQHMAVERLLEQPKIEKNAINKKKKTVVDIHIKQSRKGLGDDRIDKALKDAKAKPAKDALRQHANKTWLEEQRTSLMVVASLIATMAFQVGVNPPGGFWQDDNSRTTDPIHGTPVPAQPGESILSYTRRYHLGYKKILIYNTVALVSSLSVILYLISGLPCNRYIISFLRITLWITVTATTLTYAVSVAILTHDTDYDFWELLNKCINGWLLLIAAIFFGNAARFVWKLLGWKRKELFITFCKNLLTPNSSSTTAKDYC